MPKHAEGPLIYLLDVQVRRQDEHTFVLLCEGNNITDEQFTKLMLNLKATKLIDLRPAVIDQLVDPATDGLMQLTTPKGGA